MTALPFLLLFGAAIAGYVLNRLAARAIRYRGRALHSLPSYHGLFSFLIVVIPVLSFTLLWLALQGPVIDRITLAGLPADAFDGAGSGQAQLVLAEIKSIARGQIFGTPEDWKLAAAERYVSIRQMADWLLVGLVAALSLGLVIFARVKVKPAFRARQSAEAMVTGLMIFASTVAIFTTIGIILSLSVESLRFFQKVPVTEFLFGLNWEPQIPIREDQIAAAGAFGWIPVILGTMVITVIALVVATPIGLFSAIYLNEFAPSGLRATAKPVLEILAGVPTVVYGFFAILVVSPALRTLGADLGIPISPNTALAAGGVMGIMLIPFISSFADDALSAVPQSLRDGALGLGATRGEMMTNVVFPAALPGIVGGILLAVSRAIGETMIVVMAAGIMAKLTINPLDSVTTVTVQIVTLLIGDTAFDNPKTLAAFALGMMLFLFTLLINVYALHVVRKYREAYD
ncbi:MAG: phosphate ABC transporter permease subunit PstC [Alphaproteobacteria bacterium]|nr:MAG: phosphate ABC transporter permease subunit PstC [Alphaproteobacteria bacterium]